MVRKRGRRCPGTVMRCSTRRRAGPTRSGCWRSRRSRGCRSWCRSGTGRMLVSPFTFYRGAALPMAGRPGRHARVGAAGAAVRGRAPVQLRRRSPRRNGGWSSTSTTSTRPCPARSSGTSSGWRPAWRWPARDNGFAGQGPPRDRRWPRWPSYRQAMRDFAGDADLDVWYAHLDMDQLSARSSTVPAGKAAAQDWSTRAGQGADQGQHAGAGQADHLVDGQPRIIGDPPLIVPVEELLAATQADRGDLDRQMRGLLGEYRRTLQPDRRHLLEQFRFVRHGPQGRRRGQRRHPRAGSC